MTHKNRPQIVIADDDADLIHALTIRCTALGLRVFSALDAASAWQQIEDVQPNVVVLDVEMPRGNGLSVSEMMFHHERHKNTPIIMLTGHTDTKTIRRCHEMMAYYVAKCDDVWGRLKPLLCEILEREDSTILKEAARVEPVPEEPDPGMSLLLDAVFTAMGDGAEETSAPLQEFGEVRIPWILCIDDDEAFVYALRLRLKEHGVEVIRVSEGMEGYRQAFSNRADLILLDYELPNGNGDYILGRLKDNPVTKDIPVIVLTGRHEKTIERKMYAMGAVSYLTKPYNWPNLWAEINKHLPEYSVAFENSVSG